MRAADTTSAGARRLVLVEGEPGIGKTRLVREACREFTAAGLLVLGGRCDEEPLHGLQPFAEAVGRLAAVDGDRLARAAPADVAALAGLVPELAPFAKPALAVDADAYRYMLFRGVSRLLDPNLIGRDLVLVLDDLQWATPPTLRLLAHVMRDDDHGGVLVVATVRDTEPNEDLASLTADLYREHRVERIALTGLDPDDVGLLVAARSTGAREDDVFAKTEGNPFYVEELVRHLDESGGSFGTDSVPDSVRDTIARRLLRLPDEARRLLGIAAVSGAEFQLPTLARAADADVDAVDDALEFAVRARVVAEHPNRVGTYGFSHALIQTVLRDGLGAARQARVHRRLGEALAATGGDEGEIARHLLAAAADGSDPRPGVEAARRAAARAIARYTYDDAVALLQTAMGVLDAHGASGDPLSCRVAIALAVALRNSGVYPEREALLETAWQHASRARRRRAAGRHRDRGLLARQQSARTVAGAVEQVRVRLGDETRGALLLAAIRAAVLAGTPGDDARQLAEWALARADSFGPMERHMVLMHATIVLGASSPIERIVELARGARDAAREAGNTFELVSALSVLRLAQLGAGDLATSDEVARSYEELVRSVRIPRYMAGVEQRRADAGAARGSLRGGGGARERGVRAAAHRRIPRGPRGAVVRDLLRARPFRRDPTGSRGVVGAVRPTGVEDRAGHTARRGRRPRRRARRDRARARGRAFDVAPPDDLFFLCVAAAATTIVALGDDEHATELFELLAPHASRVVVAASGALCWGSVHRFLGPLAALTGNVERASVHFEAAMAVHERLGARPFLARDRLAVRHDAARGRRRREAVSDALDRTGRALARELGMRHLVDRS